MAQQPKFKPKERSEFSRVLRERVHAYFQETKQPITANWEMKVRTLLLLLLWGGSYAALVFGQFPLPVMYGLWALLGISVVWVALNIGHDAIHGSYSKKKWVKDLLSHTFNLNGASAYMWKISHNQAHHNYTNIHGHDEDISPAPFLRISPGTPLLPVHRFQHIYSFFFYGFATISWLFAKDYVQFFSNHINNYDGHKHPKVEYFYLFFYKLLTYGIFLVIPLVVMPYHWGHILAGFLLMQFISGFYLALIFMLAHAVEEVHFPLPEPTGIIENDWFLHQMATTANFSSQSWWAGFLSGGLNLQVEHHLFPHICTIHYRKLAGIVKQTAQEHNVPYYELPTFGAAIRSHYRFLKKLGTQEHYEPAMGF